MARAAVSVKKWWAAAAVVASGVVIAWQGAKLPSARESGLALRSATPIRLIAPRSVLHAGEIIAAKAGFFERAGLNLEVRPAQAGFDPIDSVLRGEGVFGVTDSKTFLIAASKGAPIIAFGAGYLESPVVFFATEQSGIRTPRDFIGKRVVRDAGSDTAIIYDAMLANVGLSRSEVREVRARANVEALRQGDIDVLPGRIAETGHALEQIGIRYTVIRPSDYGIHVPGTVYFTTKRLARDYPSYVQRFLNAVIAGWDVAYSEYDKGALLMVFDGVASGPEEKERVRRELKAQRDFIRPSGRRTSEFDNLQWKQLRNILISARLIDEAADLSAAVNYDFIKEAYRKPVSFGK